MKTPTYPCFVLIALAFTASDQAQEWTRFRGPNGTGISSAKTIPAKWTDQDINWKVQFPGAGHSSPVIWGDKVFLLSSEEKSQKVFVLCLKTSDGAVAWKKEFPFTLFPKHKFNSYSSSTPAVDEQRVYVCWNTPDRYTLMALDHNGKTIWERNLGPFVSQHACGSSPIVYQDMVVLANEQDGESFLIAVDRQTGVTRWQTPRKTAVAAYSTPCVYEADGRKPLLIFNSQAHGISAVNPADGQVVWEYVTAFDKRSVSSPVVASGLLIGSCGSGGGGNYVVAVRPGDSAQGKKPERAYDIRRSAPYVPTSVALGEWLFLWGDAGVVTCLHAPSGEIKWQERVRTADFFGSPVCVDNRLFAVSTTGEVVVVQASDQFKELGSYWLGELTRASPAIAGGRMYIRTESHLFSIGGKARDVSLR